MNDLQKAFVQEIAKYAISDYKRSKILPSLTIAQSILESGWGQSGLAVQAHNLFGVKASKGYKGDKQLFPTKEFENGKWITIDAYFRKYPTFEGSVIDHNTLLQMPRYSKVKGETDYKKACQEIKNAGYATDPNYPQLLIKLIEQHKLYEYDKAVTDYMLKIEDAEKIINFLKDAWEKANTDQKKKEIGRLADEIRKASGQEPENKK